MFDILPTKLQILRVSKLRRCEERGQNQYNYSKGSLDPFFILHKKTIFEPCNRYWY